MNANAEVLLFQKDGSVILQERDNKPDITNPGLISSFGGHIEPGEEPIDAAVREINEETNLRLTKDDLKFYHTYQKTKSEHGEDWTVHYFGAPNISTAGLEVYEGRGFTVIHNQEELAKANTTKLLNQVLTDYFEGYRSYIFLPDADEKTVQKIHDDYLSRCLEGHKPSTLKQPVVLACTGMVAAGKSTSTKPLTEVIDCVSISSDQVRDEFFKTGHNFSQFRGVMEAITSFLRTNKYNVFLDFNISTNIPVLDKFKQAGYKVFVIHANPPESFVKNKILTGNMKHELTYYTKDEHVYRSLRSWKADYEAGLSELRQKHGIWQEVDTSRDDLQKVIGEMKQRFKHEATQ